MPPAIGQCADLYHEVNALRLAMQKEVDAVAERANEIKQHIIDTLPKGDTGASGERYRAQVVVKEVPRVDDWHKFWDYVIAHRATDLLHRRISDKAVRETWEAGEEIPGVSTFNVVDLSITKI